MSPLVYRITTLLSMLVRQMPIGTNFGLFCLLWTLLSGRLLQTRGSLFPALSAFGLSDDAVRRSWASLTYGSWKIQPLLDTWRKIVRAEGHGQPQSYGGFRVVACDLIGFFRPRLKDCPTKHSDGEAGKALPTIPVGVIVSVGAVGSQRLGLLRLSCAPKPPILARTYRDNV